MWVRHNVQRGINLKAKDSVLWDLFAQPEYQLQMLNAFHPEMTGITVDDLQTVTLKQVVTNHQYSDLAFVVKDLMMVFVEAQSTWSVNVLIRILLYLADTLQGYIHDNQMNVHDYRKLDLPRPEFYVIYTGEGTAQKTLSLRRDFFCTDDCPLELAAKIVTAETDDIVGQYVVFCHVLDQQVKVHGRTETAARETIRICKDRGVLKTYIESREKEVIDIMIMLFDQQYATEAYGRSEAKRGREEGRKEGREEGGIKMLADLVKKGLLQKEVAAKEIGLTISEFDMKVKACDKAAAVSP